MISDIVKSGVFLDHPHIFQFIGLLDNRFDGVQQEVIDGTWLLRHNRFAVRFLSYYATKTTINPFLAVETVRLTREENQREMRKANERRMKAAVELLGRIGVDYVEHPDDYKNLDRDPQEYVRKWVVSGLSDVSEEPVISAEVRKTLDDIRAADLAQPAGPKFFTTKPE
jgi:hypothetical protein